MRLVIPIAALALLAACSSHKNAKAVEVEDVRLSNTSVASSSSLSLLDMAASWSCVFDSLDIYIEPIDCCRTSVAVVAAQPSRVRLRARHAAFDNSAAYKSSVLTDSCSVDSLAIYRSTQREQRSRSESAAVYKPPNGFWLIAFAVSSIIIVCLFKVFK